MIGQVKNRPFEKAVLAIFHWFSKLFITCIIYKSNIIWETQRPLWSWLYGSWIYNYICNQCLSPFMLWIWILDTTLCDKVCQWLTTGRWFSLGTPVSSTNKAYRHDIHEILLKVTLKHHKPNPLLRDLSISGWSSKIVYLVFHIVFFLFILVNKWCKWS